jgi:hypothetical protein
VAEETAGWNDAGLGELRGKGFVGWSFGLSVGEQHLQFFGCGLWRECAQSSERDFKLGLMGVAPRIEPLLPTHMLYTSPDCQGSSP